MPTNATTGKATSRKLEPEILKLSEIAQIFNMDRRSVDKILDEGKLKYMQYGTQRRCLRKDALAYLEDLMSGRVTSNILVVMPGLPVQNNTSKVAGTLQGRGTAKRKKA